MSNTQKWTEDRVNTLVGLVGEDQDVTVTVALVNTAATQLEVSERSISAKLRNLDYTVESTSKSTSKSYSDEDEEALRAFVESNAGTFTYGEIAEQVLDGTRSAKEIQGKILSMELFDKVKATPKAEVAKKYSDDEEVQFLALMKDGAYLEDIAEAMDRTINSVRGKALSLTRANPDLTHPKQRESHATAKVDALKALEDISSMTVAAIAEAIGKTERGVKVMLTRRGLTASDYNGAKKAAKIADKAVA